MKYGHYANNRSSSRRPKRSGKTLDTNLFIKKACPLNLQTDNEASCHRFTEYNVVDKLQSNIAAHGYITPTAIQEKAIPEILTGRDIIGAANTGTGKTAAFLISLINKCYLDRKQKVLIVVPTRELAIQLSDEFNLFSRGMGINATVVIGGANIRRQTDSLHYQPQFVIGTPGRLKDLIQRHALDLSSFQNVVLDEVDRMVDIGFLKDIQYIVSLLPKTRQSLFFSATVDARTQEILRSFVNNPVTISVTQQATAENIDQDVIRVAENSNKIDTLHDLLIQPGFNKVLVFGKTKWGMDKLSKVLVQRGFKATAIHGNKSQNQRQRALQEFKSSKVQILIATDVAARGLDIEDVTHVINYDAPATYDDYVHRIGRTGRAGKKGIALTFVN